MHLACFGGSGCLKCICMFLKMIRTRPYYSIPKLLTIVMRCIWCKVVRTWQTWLCPCILIWLPLVMSGVSQIQQEWNEPNAPLLASFEPLRICRRLQRYISMSDKQLLEPQVVHMPSEPLPTKWIKKATNERMLEAWICIDDMSQSSAWHPRYDLRDKLVFV